ncbi:MAG: NUDIX hydrolase [Deltaproteobacteria bacterium]|nr:MAG: NUDIX hydrolase [Deltaproteobacteria bacterium]
MKPKINFCSLCGSPVIHTIPEGDNRTRAVCSSCAFVHYRNPNIVVGAVCLWEDRVLLCRRAIEPRRGYWTVPAGYLEEEESTLAGARREAMEEANADIEIGPLLAIYDIPVISQVHIMFLADLKSPEVSAGEESLEVGLFAWDELPPGEYAFPTIEWVLDYARKVRHLSVFPPERRVH